MYLDTEWVNMLRSR